MVPGWKGFACVRWCTHVQHQSQHVTFFSTTAVTQQFITFVCPSLYRLLEISARKMREWSVNGVSSIGGQIPHIHIKKGREWTFPLYEFCLPKHSTIHPRLQRQSAVLLASIKLQRTYLIAGLPRHKDSKVSDIISISYLLLQTFIIQTQAAILHATCCNFSSQISLSICQVVSDRLWMYKRRCFKPALTLKRKIWTPKLKIRVTNLVKLAFRTSTS